MDIRERILESGLELFLAHGVRRITMDDIARHLSVSKKTIYACFDDKDEIVSECCQGYLKNSRCEFQHVETESKDAIHEIFLTMEKLRWILKVILVKNWLTFTRNIKAPILIKTFRLSWLC